MSPSTAVCALKGNVHLAASTTSFLITTSKDNEIQAFSENENWQDAADVSDEYVWQFAESKEQAIDQHHDKFGQWQDETQAGKEPKDIY